MVEYIDTMLADPGPGLVGLLLVVPVARGQGVALAVRDDPRLDGQLEVEVLTLVDELVSPSGSSKAHGTGRPAADRPLVAVAIPVIQVVRLDLSQ